MSEAYESIMRGLDEVEAYLKGEKHPGAIVHAPYDAEADRKREREASNLGLANFMMNNRIAKIMHKIYREEEKPNPDQTYLAALRTSHSAVWKDRHAMQGGKPDIVVAMLEKYERLKGMEPTIHQ